VEPVRTGTFASLWLVRSLHRVPMRAAFPGAFTLGLATT
jgi:hypothetical protein